jgi:8-oxo-dGTP pyrophosphatase MutT (NUDIX family)
VADREETSAGGVVFRRSQGSIQVALGEQRDRLTGDRNTRLPKGKPDPGETLEETALREVLEETGLLARVTAPLGSVSYHYGEGTAKVAKRVHFFLMELVSDQARSRDGELDRVYWCPIQDAAGRLSFATERDVMERAHRALGG